MKITEPMDRVWRTKGLKQFSSNKIKMASIITSKGLTFKSIAYLSINGEIAESSEYVRSTTRCVKSRLSYET